MVGRDEAKTSFVNIIKSIVEKFPKHFQWLNANRHKNHFLIFRSQTILYRQQSIGKPDIAANLQNYPPTKSGIKAVERNQLNWFRCMCRSIYPVQTVDYDTFVDGLWF